MPVLPGDHSCKAVKPRSLKGSTWMLAGKRKAGFSIFATGAYQSCHFRKVGSHAIAFLNREASCKAGGV
jgi:hypothetical protein